jgi:hypothetical protein
LSQLIHFFGHPPGFYLFFTRCLLLAHDFLLYLSNKETERKVAMRRWRACLAAGLFLFLTACASEESGQTVEGEGLDPAATIAVRGTTQVSAEEAAGNPVALSGSVTKLALGDEIKIEGSGAAVQGNVVTIQAGGNYSLSGTLKQGQVVVDAEKADVTVEFAGVSLNNETGPAFYVKEAKKVILVLKSETVNSLSDGAVYASDDQKAAVFSEAPLLLRGNGSLELTGSYKHALASDDTLVVEGGHINVISAVSDGFHANDEIAVKGGDIKITCDSDGMESEKHLTIDGGLLEIAAGDDGLHADKNLTLRGGTINITRSFEGIEAKDKLSITGGGISIMSDDDAVNAGSDLTILGGSVYAECSGDGLDSNGNMTISGGTVTVFSDSGGNGPIDIGDRGYTFTVAGGTVLCTGGSMGIRVDEASSTQPSLWINAAAAANATLSIAVEGGGAVLSAKLPASSGLIFYSSEKLEKGRTYTAEIDGAEVGAAALSGMSASIGESGGGMGGWGDFSPGEGGRRPRGGGGQAMPEEMPSFAEGERPSFPAGGTPPEQ